LLLEHFDFVGFIKGCGELSVAAMGMACLALTSLMNFRRYQPWVWTLPWTSSPKPGAAGVVAELDDTKSPGLTA